jgi:hypothetical protein
MNLSTQDILSVRSFFYDLYCLFYDLKTWISVQLLSSKVGRVKICGQNALNLSTKPRQFVSSKYQTQHRA